MVHCNLTITCGRTIFHNTKNDLCLKAITINPPFFHFLLIRWSMLHNIIHTVITFFKYQQVHHGKLNFYLHLDANYLVLQTNWPFTLPFQTIRLLYFEPKGALFYVTILLYAIILLSCIDVCYLQFFLILELQFFFIKNRIQKKKAYN